MIRDLDPQIVVNIGDFTDCFSVSRHSKSPQRVLGFVKEMEMANKLLDEFDAAAPNARKIFLEGNHETRLQRYIEDKAPELFGAVTIPERLGLKERGWEFVAYRDDIRVGRVFFTHDVGTAGRYAVYRNLDAYQSSIVCGHTHRLSYAVEGDATGQRKVSASFGWLGDTAQIDYMHKLRARKEWTLGFGVGYLDPRSGFVSLVPVPVVQGKCVVEGRLYGDRPSLKAAA